VALRWFCAKSLLGSEGLTRDLIDRIPGKQTDRKTPLGELNWIFTAITDTIAWNTLPRALFQKLFRQVGFCVLFLLGSDMAEKWIVDFENAVAWQLITTIMYVWEAGCMLGSLFCSLLGGNVFCAI